MHRGDVFSPPHPEQFWQSAESLPMVPRMLEEGCGIPSLPPSTVHPAFPTARPMEDMLWDKAFGEAVGEQRTNRKCIAGGFKAVAGK